MKKIVLIAVYSANFIAASENFFNQSPGYAQTTYNTDKGDKTANTATARSGLNKELGKAPEQPINPNEKANKSAMISANQ